jgi:dUTP pyrophosphatase
VSKGTGKHNLVIKMTFKFYLDKSITDWSFEAPVNGDAGYDIRAAVHCIIKHKEQSLIATKLYLAIPFGWVGIVKDRSSMASKRIYTHGGVIDAGYRGEVKILLSNQSDDDYEVCAGNKIAQLVVLPCMSECIKVEDIDSLGETMRGANGFGSTGK